MSDRLKILLVEDDTNLGFLMVDFLESKGFDVKLYRDGETGLQGFRNGRYDFCILDVMLPKLNGFNLAEFIRQDNQDIPIILLTAKNQDEDKLKGFSLGIDDYITKPFNEEELVCRIHAINSRLNRGKTIAPIEDEDYKIGKFEFCSRNQMLNDAKIEKRLTKTESEVLQVLCHSMNNIVSRKEIMERVWGEEDYFVGRSLDVFVSKLRKYLAADPNIQILSIPKVGLILQVEN